MKRKASVTTPLSPAPKKRRVVTNKKVSAATSVEHEKKDVALFQQQKVHLVDLCFKQYQSPDPLQQEFLKSHPLFYHRLASKQKSMMMVVEKEKEETTLKILDQSSASLFKCRKCRATGEAIQFTSIQIRSADEPMTNFFNCNKCGHHWTES